MIMPRGQESVVRLPRWLPAGSRSHFMRCPLGTSPFEGRTQRRCMKGSPTPVGHQSDLTTHVRLGSDRPTPSSSTSPTPAGGRASRRGPPWDESLPAAHGEEEARDLLPQSVPPRVEVLPPAWHRSGGTSFRSPSPRLARSSSHANPLASRSKAPSRTPPERHLPFREWGKGARRVENRRRDEIEGTKSESGGNVFTSW
jgi:hypothetical protein